jgi:hypothetical protein
MVARWSRRVATREEPAREVRVARVEGNGGEWQVGPCGHQLGDGGDGAHGLASDAVLEVERTEHEVLAHVISERAQQRL